MNEGTKIVLKIVGIIGGLAILAGALFAYMQPKIDERNNAQRTALLAVRDSDHIIGDPAKAKVLFIEYSDLQCPACKLYHPAVKEIIANNKDNLAFIYRHFPLYPTPHKNSLVAAQAVEAAGLQGKFWEMTDVLFDKQTEWDLADNPQTYFEDYAKALNLDLDKFRADYVSDATLQRVNTDTQNAKDLSIRSTPSFFVNGQQVRPQDGDQLKQFINDALNK